MKFKKQLQEIDACREATRWVGDKSLREAWNTCERGDWMLWYYFKVKGFDKHLVRAKVDCASLVSHLMKDQRSLDALQACYDYVDGKIGVEELKIASDAAAHAARTAVSAAYDAYAEAYAAHAAYHAAAAGGAADAAYDAYAAYRAAYDANVAAYDAHYKTLKECANICREVLTKYL